MSPGNFCLCALGNLTQLGKKFSYPAGQTIWKDIMEKLLGKGEALTLHRKRQKHSQPRAPAEPSPGPQVPYKMTDH